MNAAHREKLHSGRSQQVGDKTSSAAASLYAKGVYEWNEGRREEAVAAIDAALRLQPDFPQALAMGAYILGALAKPEAAIAFYRRALELDPRSPLVWSNLGKQLFNLRRFRKALEAFERALTLSPGDADLWNCQAGVLRELGRLEESILAAREALRLQSDFAEAALNLGNASVKLDRMEDALHAYQRALACKPDLASAHCGAALALKGLGRFDEARLAFDEAERLGSPEATSGRGCLQLLCGDLESGWEGYEARWADGRSLREVLGARFREWKGLEDPARRLLVLNDHGLGDTIQFCRYLPHIRAAGVAVSLVCPERLHRLLAPLGVELLAETPSDQSFDAQIAVSSLPRAFKTRTRSQSSKRALSRGRTRSVLQMGSAHRRQGLQDWLGLAGQSESGSGYGALDPVARLRSIIEHPERPALFLAEGLWDGAAEGHSSWDDDRNFEREF